MPLCRMRHTSRDWRSSLLSRAGREEADKTAGRRELLRGRQKLDAALQLPLELPKEAGGVSVKKFTRSQDLEMRVATPVDGLGGASGLDCP